MNDESIFEEGKKPARRQADRNTHMNIKVRMIKKSIL